MLFGEIAGNEMQLNELGKIVLDEWQKSSIIRREIELDCFVVMPNHIHGIVNFINADVGATGWSPLRSGPPARSLGAVAGFKSAVTKRVNEKRQSPGVAVWQRNYYEHIIRDDEELRRVREYIRNNPLSWENDRENPSRPADWKFTCLVEPWLV